MGPFHWYLMIYAYNIFKNFGLVNQFAPLPLNFFYIYYDNSMRHDKRSKKIAVDRGRDRDWGDPALGPPAHPPRIEAPGNHAACMPLDLLIRYRTESQWFSTSLDHMISGGHTIILMYP